MRAVYGLIIVLLMLGPIGMGILFNVDAPLLEESEPLKTEEPQPEAHGTRAKPAEVPTFIRLYLHEGSTMNTSTFHYIRPDASPGDITFTLQDQLIRDFFIGDTSGKPGMRAQVWLAGTDSLLTINVYDNEEGGTLVGSGSYGPFNNNPTIPSYTDIDIHFMGGNENYTFPEGHVIVVEFDFSLGTGILHYDYTGVMSNIRFNGIPITDIAIDTYNFFGEPERLFYPNNIDFPDERKKIEVMGVVSDVFGKWDRKYIDRVQVQIKGPGMNQTFDAGWNRNTNIYTYTWLYLDNQTSGEYTATAHVFDQQDIEYTVNNTFNMSDYGALLTSPSQVGPEGSYQTEQAKAKRNVVQGNKTEYHINVRNIGAFPTNVEIDTTSGPPGWDWELDGENLTSGQNTKIATTMVIGPGMSKGVKFIVDSKNNDLGDKATIQLTATPTGDTSLDSTLTTVTLVVLKYNVQLKFSDGTSTPKQKTVELGGQTTYDFSVGNTGGANDKIWVDIGSGPSGWSTTLGGEELKSVGGRYYVELASGTSTDLTLTVTAPTGGGDETANFDITGTSQGSQDQGDDPVAADRITTITKKTTGMKFELISDGVLEVDPDDQVSYVFQLTNTGTGSNNFTAEITDPDIGGEWELGDISFSQNSYVDEQKYPNLAQDGQQIITLWVKPTFDVLAGNYSITVRVERDDTPLTRNDEKTVYIIVNEFYEIELIEPPPIDPELFAEAEPGEDVEFTIKFKNIGNTQEKVAIFVDRPSDWELHFGNASSVWEEDLDPQQSEEVTLVLTVPDDEEGDKTVDITISVVPAESDTIFVETHTKIKSFWYEPIMTLLVPILLLVVIIVMVIVIYKRR
jgi:uncharacterized membrane protein